MLALKPGLRGKSGFTHSQMLLVMALLTLLAVSLVTVGFSLPGKIFSGSTSTSGLQTIHSQTAGYALQVPADWKIVNQDQFGVMSATSPYKGAPVMEGGLDGRRSINNSVLTNTPANGFSKIDVLVYDLEYQVDPREFMRVMSVDPKTNRISDIQVAGQKAIKVEAGTGGALHDYQNVNYISVFVTTPTRGYIIAGFAEPEVFAAIINSFQTF